MYTVSDIIADINRGCFAHNMIEDKFSYRIVFFVNDGNKGQKHYLDTSHGGLRAALENIIRGNLTMTNSIVLAAVTARKNGKIISLLSKPYPFSLSGYFKQISGEVKDRSRNMVYGRYAVR